MSKMIISGKRKTAVAKATITEGKGIVTLNNQNYHSLSFFNKLRIEEPLLIAKEVLGELSFDIHVKATGGGEKGQVEAARLAIAKAIVAFTKSMKLRKTYLDYDRNILVADTRRKEAYKPGDSKARANRQTSYR